MSNTPDGTINLSSLSSRRNVLGKFLSMRKAQSFVVYPVRDGATVIIVQSDKSIGRFNYRTGVGAINLRGKYFAHLTMAATPFMFPSDFVGRGDMSRGGLMLRAARASTELRYVSVRGAVLKGKRPPKLG